jgi:tetratricopeptide (TPR) repeat protein
LEQLRDENKALRMRLEEAELGRREAALQSERALQAENAIRIYAAKAEAVARAEADKAAEVDRRLRLDVVGTAEGNSPEEKLVISLLAGGQGNQKAGRIAEAQELYQKAIEAAEATVKQQPDAVAPRALLARAWEFFGNLKLQQGNTAEAEALLQRALELERALLQKAPSNPDLHEQFASGLLKWGSLLQKTGRLDQAQADLERARTVVEQLVRERPDRPSTRAALADSLEALSELKAATGRAQEADALRRKSQEIRARLAQEKPGQPTAPRDQSNTETRAADSPRAQEELREQAARLDQLMALNEQLRMQLLKVQQAEADAKKRASEEATVLVDANLANIKERVKEVEKSRRNAALTAQQAEEVLRQSQPVPSGTATSGLKKFVPLPPGQTSESLRDFTIRLDRETAEGWEFAGTADVRLTASEFAALEKGQAPGPAVTQDETGSVHRVYVFRRAVADTRALER